jgi:hypothetical protein
MEEKEEIDTWKIYVCGGVEGDGIEGRRGNKQTSM